MSDNEKAIIFNSEIPCCQGDGERARGDDHHDDVLHAERAQRARADDTAGTTSP